VLRQDIDSIGPGEICAIFGVECSSGDTFTDGSTSFSMVSIINYREFQAFDIDSYPPDIHVRARACHLVGHQTRGGGDSEFLSCVESVPEGRSYVQGPHRSRKQGSKQDTLHMCYDTLFLTHSLIK
jgi:hypothetical protein